MFLSRTSACRQGNSTSFGRLRTRRKGYTRKTRCRREGGNESAGWNGGANLAVTVQNDHSLHRQVRCAESRVLPAVTIDANFLFDVPVQVQTRRW